MRCPLLRRTFLPPEPERLPRGSVRLPASSSIDGTPLSDGSTAGASEVEATGLSPAGWLTRAPHALVFTTGFVLCLFLTLI